MRKRLKRAWVVLTHTSPPGASYGSSAVVHPNPLWQRVQDALVLFIAGDTGYIINQSFGGAIHLRPDGPPRNGVYYSRLPADISPATE